MRPPDAHHSLPPTMLNAAVVLSVCVCVSALGTGQLDYSDSAVVLANVQPLKSNLQLS